MVRDVDEKVEDAWAFLQGEQRLNVVINCDHRERERVCVCVCVCVMENTCVCVCDGEHLCVCSKLVQAHAHNQTECTLQ